MKRSSTFVGSLGLLLVVAVALSVHPAGSATPTLVHSPYLQKMQADSVTVMWSTRENMAATVLFSPDRNYSSSVPARVRVFTTAQTKMSFPFYQYQADLTGLAPDTRYFYRILMDGNKITTDEESQFRTPGSLPFRFLVFGDSGTVSAGQQALTRLMATEQANFVLQLGDIAYEEGTFAQFTDTFFSVYATIMKRVPFFTVPGNHEYYTSRALPYLSLTSVPTAGVPEQDQGRYYSFDWANTHFVALDSNLFDAGFSAADELRWLQNDLASTTAKWKIAFFHHVPYPVEHHTTDPLCIAARSQLVPILERYGVQLVLTGHEHAYLRSKPLHGDATVSTAPSTLYVTSGGGGGQLHPVVANDRIAYEAGAYHYLTVEVSSSQIVIQAIGTDGKAFDRATLALPSVRSEGPVLNSASFTADLAPGGLMSIFGEGLGTATSAAASFPLPTALAGSTVTFDGTPVPLTFVSPGQINAQLPMNAASSGRLRVSTLSGTAEVMIHVTDSAPGIFCVRHANGTAVDMHTPASPGETLLVYMTGLGQVNGGIAAGEAAPLDHPVTVTNPVDVQIGDMNVKPDFAGLAPGWAGLYQVNVTIPRNLPNNSYPLKVTTKGGSCVPQLVPIGVRNP